jgi:hypothetical protein
METEVQDLVAHAGRYKGQHFFDNRSTSDQPAPFRIYLIHPCPAALHGGMLDDYTYIFNSLA